MQTFCIVRVETTQGHTITCATEHGALVIKVEGGVPLNSREEVLLLEAIGRHLESEGTDSVPVLTTEELHERLNRQFEQTEGPTLLSVRAINAISRVTKSPYVGDLVQLTERDLLLKPNCGRLTLKQIKDFLAGMQLHLGMTQNELRGWQAPRPPSP